MNESIITVKRKASVAGFFARTYIPYFREHKELWDKLYKGEVVSVPKEIMEHSSARMYLEEVTNKNEQEKEETSEPVFRSFKKSRKTPTLDRLGDETEENKVKEND